jgi:guanylate kinase
LSRRKGIVVISAPSGSGKTTIYREILRRNPELRFSVSYTTRSRREGETDGRDYFFVGRDVFERMAREGRFVEWARVHGELYGTERSQLERSVAEGKVILLDVDVQGAVSVMKEFPEAVTIFIEPPSLEELARRLRKRGTESDESVRLRLRGAERELAYRNRFQYIVVNDRLDESIQRIENIINRVQLERT